MRLTRRRLSNQQVVLTVWAFTLNDHQGLEYKPVAYIRRVRVNGTTVYVLLTTRDWYVNTYGTLREAVERGSHHKF